MNGEYETMAWVDGKLVDVVATYEMDGGRALVYGVFTLDGDDIDVTEKIHPDEFDRIYWAICTSDAESRIEAAEMAADMER